MAQGARLRLDLPEIAQKAGRQMYEVRLTGGTRRSERGTQVKLCCVSRDPGRRSVSGEVATPHQRRDKRRCLLRQSQERSERGHGIKGLVIRIEYVQDSARSSSGAVFTAVTSRLELGLVTLKVPCAISQAGPQQ